MKIVSWRGWEPADDGIWIGIEDSVRGAWQPSFSTAPRLDNSGSITGVSIGGRAIECQFGNDGSTPRTAEETWKLGLERLNPLDTTPGELVVELNDASEWSCEAVITLPGATVDETVNTFDVVWYTTDPLWHSTDVSTAAGALTPVTITNPTFATDVTGWTKGAGPANVTSSFSRDAGVFFDAAGSGKLVVSANTGAGGTVYVLNDQKIACSPGDIIDVKARLRTTNDWDIISESGIGVDAVVRFYTVADAFITEQSDWFLSQPADTWQTQQTNPPLMNAPAPANTAYFVIGVKIRIDAGQTGTVYFDDFEFVSAPRGTSVTPIVVGGNAPTHLTMTVTPAGDFPQAVYARTFSITNNGVKVLRSQPVWVPLGDNSSGATTGSYWMLLRDGKPQRCGITDYDSREAWLLMVVDYLPVGGRADYTLLVSDQTILPGAAWQFNSYTRPAFDAGHHYGSASGGGHSTTVTNTSGLGSESNRWRDGIIKGLTGVNAGLTRRITLSTSTQLTHAAFPSAFSNGDQYLVMMSHNGILTGGEANWVYPVRQTERNDSTRGLWWIDSGQKRPSDYREDVPGSWHLSLYYDNKDHFAQKWYTPVDPGGGNDYFAILDTNRTWEDGSEFKEQGGYDGVAINTAFPMTGMVVDYSLKNPNGMCRFIVGSRQLGGALGYVHEWEDSSASTALSNKSAQTLTFEPDTYEAAMHLIPNYGDEIGSGWARDEGTATGATSTTLSDSNKEWISGQWTGGTVRIVSGTGAGQTVAITASGPNSVTVGSWPIIQPDTTSRYILRNKSLVSTVRSYQRCYLRLDMTNLTVSAVSAETPAFILYRDLLIDYNTAGDPYQRVTINPETTGRYICLLANESLVIDGAAMRAWIADTGTGAEIRTVPPQAYTVLDVAADGSRRAAARWLWVNPGTHEVSLATDESGVGCAIDVQWIESLYG